MTQLKHTLPEIGNLYHQRPDLFKDIPPAERMPGDPPNVYTLTVDDDTTAAALIALDPGLNLGPVPDQVPLFKARYIMQTTPHGNGTLLEAVLSAINQIQKPEDRTLAEIALIYGDTFSRTSRLMKA